MHERPRIPLICGVCGFPQGPVCALILDAGSFDALITIRFATSQPVEGDGLCWPALLAPLRRDHSAASLTFHVGVDLFPGDHLFLLAAWAHAQ